MKTFLPVFFCLTAVLCAFGGEIKRFSCMAETFRVPTGVFELTEQQSRKQSHYVFQYDDQKRVVRIESREPAGYIKTDFFNVEVLTFEYDANGVLVKRVWRSPENRVNLVWRYNGDKITFEDTFMAEYPPSELIPFRDGIFQNTTDCDLLLFSCGNVAGLQLVKDKTGNVCRILYLRQDGKPGMDPMGTAGQQFERDEYGRFTRAIRLNGQLQRHADSYGVAEYRLKYEAGLRTEIACLGMDGKPILNNQCFAYLRTKKEADGKIRFSYFGINNEPVVNAQYKFSSMVTEYGYDGRILSHSFYGPDDRACSERHGVTRIQYTALTRNVEEVSFVTLDGRDPRDEDFYPGTRVRITRDAHQRITQKDWFAGRLDVPIVTMKYTRECGIQTGETMLKNDEVLLQMEYDRAPNGTMRHRVAKMKDGTVVKEEFYEYSPCGTTIKHYSTQHGGYRCELDENGQAVRRIPLDESGKDMSLCITMKYDDSGHCVEQIAEGYPETIPPRTVFTFDPRGNIVRENRFSQDGKPFKKGPAVVIRKYDARGNQTLVQGENADGGLALLYGASYAVRRQSFDDRDRLVSAMWLDDDFSPVAGDPNASPIPGYGEIMVPAIVQNQYDETDSLVGCTLFPEEEEGFPALNGTNMIRVSIRRYQEPGIEYLAIFYKNDDTFAFPVKDSKAVALRFCLLDGKIRISYLDQAGKPVFAPSEGFAEQLFDSRTEESVFLDADGKEIPGPKENESGENIQTEQKAGGQNKK